MLQTGLFGKIPALGDFLSRRLPGSFSEPWDQFLQTVLEVIRNRDSNGWQESFDAWVTHRFAFDAGVCGPLAAIGLMAPSQDRVGRRFPLTLVALLPTGWDPLTSALGTERWSRLGLALLRDLRTPHADPVTIDRALEELDGALEDLDAATLPDSTGCIDLFRQAGGWQVELPRGAGLAYHLGGMGVRALRAEVSGVALLWPVDGGGPIAACQGLPSAVTAAELFGATIVMAAERAGRVLGASAPRGSVQSASPGPARDSRGTVAERDEALVAAPGIVYLACSGWQRGDAPDGALATRFRDLFRSAPGDVPTALGNTFGRVAGPAASAATWLPDEDGGCYAWFGSAAIFRVRGGELSRLAPANSPPAGDSLADLLGASSSEHRADATLTVPADVEDGDRVLLCADGSYSHLSWGQLMSALQERRPQRAAERLAGLWSRPDASVPCAIVLAFDLTSEGLEATHALVARAEGAA